MMVVVPMMMMMMMMMVIIVISIATSAGIKLRRSCLYHHAEDRVPSSVFYVAWPAEELIHGSINEYK